MVYFRLPPPAFRLRAALSFLLSAACLLPFSSGCAAYHFGNASLFPPDITTVYVPMIESHSFRPDMGEALTEAVCKEIEKQTPYKVVGNPNADSILTVRLIQDSKRVIDINKFDEARSTEVNYQCQVTWASRKGSNLYEGAVPLPPQFVGVDASGPYIPEYGQSYVTAQYEAMQKLAKQIVGLMERPW